MHGTLILFFLKVLRIFLISLFTVADADGLSLLPRPLDVLLGEVLLLSPPPPLPLLVLPPPNIMLKTGKGLLEELLFDLPLLPLPLLPIPLLELLFASLLEFPSPLASLPPDFLRFSCAASCAARKSLNFILARFSLTNAEVAFMLSPLSFELLSLQLLLLLLLSLLLLLLLLFLFPDPDPDDTFTLADPDPDFLSLASKLIPIISTNIFIKAFISESLQGPSVGKDVDEDDVLLLALFEDFALDEFTTPLPLPSLLELLYLDEEDVDDDGNGERTPGGT
mmetsp:Transcript_14795/g.22135  ORF Transcript_14795/g.22135 Transcript_14795/m.22135 type:complete len:280 (-) Transcript_14795:1959-2798(-)